MAMDRRDWGGSLHQTFRLRPPEAGLRVFLESDGMTPHDVLTRLPYDAARARGRGTGTPDPKRYRDRRHVYQLAGLLYETGGQISVTELGTATRRWLDKVSDVNMPVLGRHAAYALAACQLRNPSLPGRSYAEDVRVFPFAFVWRAMLALDGVISSDELNRVIFRTTDADSLHLAIDDIREHRASGESVDALGTKTISGSSENDRIIPWICLASFGWLLIMDKREADSPWYQIRPRARHLLDEASQMRHEHRDFESIEEYVQHISDAACLPLDVR